jgi:hypothetical protein
MTTDEKLAAILTAVQTDPGNRGLGRDPQNNLFTCCAGDFGAACRSLAESPSVCPAIVTGFFIPSADPPSNETDGPLGSLFLARSLAALGHRSVVVSDSSLKNVLLSTVAGLKLHDSIVPLSIPPRSHPWYAFLALDWQSVCQGYHLSHLISIECVGPSWKDGRSRSMRALDLTEFVPPSEYLFDDNCGCNRRLPTIGIGDGGNEIGMGRIPWAMIARNIKNGEQIACRVPTDHLVVAGVSNWGAYALAAGVFLLRGVKPPPELFDPNLEHEILEAMVREGPLVDGVTGKQTATVDGLSWDEYVKPLLRIQEILETP